MNHSREPPTFSLRCCPLTEESTLTGRLGSPGGDSLQIGCWDTRSILGLPELLVLVKSSQQRSGCEQLSKYMWSYFGRSETWARQRGSIHPYSTYTSSNTHVDRSVDAAYQSTPNYCSESPPATCTFDLCKMKKPWRYTCLLECEDMPAPTRRDGHHDRPLR